MQGLSDFKSATPSWLDSKYAIDLHEQFRTAQSSDRARPISYQRRRLYIARAKKSNPRLFDERNRRADLFGERFIFDADNFEMRLIDRQ